MNEPRHTVNVVDFEREIGTILGGNGGDGPAPSKKGRPLPALPPVNDIGRLSAEAVLKQWEQTAADIESMAAEVKDRAAKLESALRDCDEDLKLLGQAAQKIRSKGEAIHKVIEAANETSKNIRDIVADFNHRVS